MIFVSFFFFNDTATTEIYTLSLHDALPISPGEHKVIDAPSSTIALAYPEHPGYPHPPQFAPGRTPMISSILGSICTSNFLAANAKNNPIAKPVTPKITTAITIASILTSKFSFYLNFHTTESHKCHCQ